MRDLPATDLRNTAPPATPRPATGRSIRSPLVRRLSLLALLPTAATALLLVALFTYWHLQQLRDLTQRSAEAVAAQVASAAGEALAAADRRALQDIASAALRQPDISRIRMLGADGRVLVDAGAARAAEGADRLAVTRPVRARGGDAVGSVQLEVSLAPVIARQRRDAAKAMVLLAFSLLAAGLVGWRAARRICAPITALADAVTRLDGAEDTIHVPLTADGEIGQLQRGFNAAAAALQDSQRNLRAQVAQATRELEHKNSALETASLARARFLAAASHDLRQPLYALTLFSSALALGEKNPARLSRIRHIQDCVGSLDRLFAELLDLSRLDAGAMQPAPIAFPLDGLFDDVSRTFRMAAEERGLRLIVRKTGAWVHTDRVMLARILNNLVSNAVRYTQAGGILVGARGSAGAIRIDVWDTGPGIAREHRRRVFEEFYQVHCPPPLPSRERRGLGLGLSTVQRLCALLEMPLALQSRPGRGSVFSVTVPAAQPAPATLRTPPPLPDRPLDVTGLRVLVIDDEPSILEGIDILMSSWGCEVRTAEDGAQALRVAGEWGLKPDIVISDLQLGAGHSGLEVLNALSRYYGEEARPRFARLLITGETKAERLREISAARIPVLYKPVTPNQLREAMVATLAMEHA